MTTTATQSPRNTVSPIAYHLPLDNTEALAEFDYQGTTARTLADFPGYAFTKDGRVLSLRRKVWRYLSPGKADGDYRFVNLPCQGRQKSFLLHRLIARAFIPNPEGKAQVNHLNASPGDNSAANLEWATHAENAEHRTTVAKPVRRTTPEKVEQLVTLYQSGLSLAAAANEANINYRAAAKAIKAATSQAA